jgi:hypothetical protein
MMRSARIEGSWPSLSPTCQIEKNAGKEKKPVDQAGRRQIKIPDWVNSGNE